MLLNLKLFHLGFIIFMWRLLNFFLLKRLWKFSNICKKDNYTTNPFLLNMPLYLITNQSWFIHSLPSLSKFLNPIPLCFTKPGLF